MEVFRLMGKIVINRGEVSAELRSIESEAKTVGQRIGATFERIGNAIHKALVVGGAAATTAIVGVGVAGVKAFADFEKGMREVFTLLPGLDRRIRNELTQGVKNLSQELGILPREVIPALYQAISAGIPRENVLDFLRTAGKAAIGGVTDLKTAVDGLTSVVNAYGITTMSATRAADIMFTAVRLGKTTMEEFSSTLFQVVPVAAQLGVSFEEVAAWMTQLTLQGTPTSVAMTQIRSALVALTKDSTEASKIFQQITGQSFPEFIAKGGNVADALDILRRYSEKTGTSLAAMFGRIEGAMAVLGVTGEKVAEFRDKIDQMKASAGATDAAFAEMEQGLGRTFAKLRAWWDVTLIEIGRALEEPIRNFVDLLERNRDKIQDLVVNIFRQVANALQWFIENGQIVAWSIGLISTAFAVLWVTAHPIAAAIIAIGTALGIIIGQATKAAETIEQLKATYQPFQDLLQESRETLMQLAEEYGVNTRELALLANALESAASEAATMLRQGAEAEDVLRLWRERTREVLNEFKAAYPEMADFVDAYMRSFSEAVETELKLQTERIEAQEQVQEEMEETAEAMEAYKFEVKDLSAVIEELSQIALPGLREAFREVSPEAQKQREDLIALLAEAHKNTIELKALTWGTEEWGKATQAAVPILEKLRVALRMLLPENRDLREEIERMIRKLEEAGAGLKAFVPTAKTVFGKLVEYAVEWVTSWGLQLREFGFSWEAFTDLMVEGAEELGSAVGRAIYDMFEGSLAAAEQYARDMEAAQATYLERMESAQRRYEQSRLSATERFIQQVQREGKTVQEREAIIAEAVARGLITEEEANAARARMTDERIAYEKSAIGELEAAVKRAEQEKLEAEKLAAAERAKAAEEAAARKKEAEFNFLKAFVKVVATALRAAAQEMAAMAGAQTALAIAFGLALDFVAAQAAAAKAVGYGAAATGLLAAAELVESLAGLARGGLVIEPTLAVVGEGQHEEAVLPLTDAVFAKIGAGIIEAMGKVRYPDMANWPEYRIEERISTISFERMFEGAVINVKDKTDIEDLAAEIQRRFVDRQRGVGVVGVIR